MARHPTGPRQNARKKAKKRYQSAREDAQLLDLIPTSPDGAVKPEVVDPTTQNEQRFPGLISQAIRRGWGVPDEKKPGLVDELIEVVEDYEAPPVAKVMAFNALAKGDQLQHERDQEWVKLEQVLTLWRGVLEAIRNHVLDEGLVKLIVADVLRLMPAPQSRLTIVSEE